MIPEDKKEGCCWQSLRSKHVDPSVNITYQPIGSGGGIKQFTKKTVGFGATDAPLSPEEAQKAPGAVHVPVVPGSDAPRSLIR